MPNIHPGSITSTGRNHNRSSQNHSPYSQQHKTHLVSTSDLSAHHQNIAGILYSPTMNYSMSAGSMSPGSIPASAPLRQNNVLMVAAATSTQNAAAQQLIGGAISPSLFNSIPLAAPTITPSLNTISNNLHNHSYSQQTSSTNPSQQFNNIF